MATLVEELPYAATVETDELSTTCSACFVEEDPNNKLRKCSGCKVVHYCNKTCQIKDWPDHKLECKLLKCSPAVPHPKLRLISRVAMKIARGDTSKAFNGRTIDDLMDHQVEIQEDAVEAPNSQSIFLLLTQYHGKQFVVDFAQFISIYGKIHFNAFTIEGDLGKPRGWGLYLGISIHNHSCWPDCFVIFDGAKAVVRAPTSEMKYSTELTTGYVVTTPVRHKRREKLKKEYYFDCYCKLCEDCTQDQWRQSVVSTCCVGGVCLLDPTADQLSCNICKKISPTSVAEAVAANEELDRILTTEIADVGSLATADMQGKLQFAIELHEKYKKILSRYNVSLVDLVERISTMSEKLRDFARIQKYSLNAIQAYKKYHPVGDPSLTMHMLQMAHRRGYSDSQNPFVLRLYEETYKLALISHGPKHNVTSIVQTMIHGFHNGYQPLSL